MNKKGDTLAVALLISLTLVILSSALILTSARLMSNSDTTAKINIAEDLRLMINTLVGLPGDSRVIYPNDVSDYSITIDNEVVAVFKKGDPKTAWITRNFNLPNGYEALGVYQGPGKLCLGKEQKRFFLERCKDNEK